MSALDHQFRPANYLLAALPDADYERIRPHLRTHAVAVKQALRHVGEPVDTVYFPNGGVASLVTTTTDGQPVEWATVGVEGLIGVEASFLPNARALAETIEQVGDTTMESMNVGAFREEMNGVSALRDVVSRYAHVLLATSMQSTLCNALHQLPNRCARWLLMTHDRVQQPQFSLSHEFLATMLGVQRPTVTLAAGALQEAGFLRYRHGRVTIVDRAGLEEASCDCYATVRGHFNNAGVRYPGAV